MSLLITEAVAASNAAAQQASPWGSLIMLGGFILIFYFLLWRPQSKRAKEQRDLIGSLQQGDEVVTSGGLVGSISTVGDSFITLCVAKDLEVKLQKSAVTQALPKGTIKSS